MVRFISLDVVLWVYVFVFIFFFVLIVVVWFWFWGQVQSVWIMQRQYFRFGRCFGLVVVYTFFGFRWQCFLEVSGMKRIFCFWFRSKVVMIFLDLMFQGYSLFVDVLFELFFSYKKGQFGFFFSLQVIFFQFGVDGQFFLNI